MPDPTFQFLAPIFKPVAQAQRRNAVVPVVALNGLEKIAEFFWVVPKRHRRLERLESNVCVTERDDAGECVERFEAFDGIALHGCPDSLADGAIEINEHPSPHEFVYLIDASRVFTRKPLDGGRLIGSVVIDVHLRVLTPSLHHLSYECLECVSLFGTGQRPEGLIGRLATRSRVKR